MAVTLSKQSAMLNKPQTRKVLNTLNPYTFSTLKAT